MPPPSQKSNGQASISAFFKPKPSSTLSSSIIKQSQPDPSTASNGKARKSLFSDTSSSSAPEPPHKRAKLNDDEKPRRETIDRMGKWKFAPADSQATSSQESNGGTAKADARHEAFRKKLLGSNFAVDRHARNQMQIEEMSSRDPFSPSEGRADTGAEDDAIVVDDDEDVDEGDATPNRFGRFAAGSSSSSARRESASSKSKGKGKATDTEPTYTPLEKQILELKAAHPGVLLIIEVGYKLKFYGDDARIASKELNIMCFP